YLYEYGVPSDGSAVREHDPAVEMITLADYRRRHAQYKTDPHLAALHARVPFVATWDDHESANNAWSGGAENHTEPDEGTWAERRAASQQAYAEWMPVRYEPGGRLYRRFGFGTRSTKPPRTWPPCTHECRSWRPGTTMSPPTTPGREARRTTPSPTRGPGPSGVPPPNRPTPNGCPSATNPAVDSTDGSASARWRSCPCSTCAPTAASRWPTRSTGTSTTRIAPSRVRNNCVGSSTAW